MEAQIALDWATLDRLAGETNVRCSLDIPFPAGACTYLRRDYLNELVEKGQEAHLGGWRHVLAPGVCVRLANGAFNSIAQWPAELPAPPFAKTALECYLLADAARFYRRRLDLARLAGPGQAMLLVTHFGGGGVERHVRELANALEDEGIRAIILRPLREGGLQLQRFSVPATPNLWFDFEMDYHALRSALVELHVEHIHVHHTLGHPLELRSLLDDLNIPYDFTVHDYRVICPRIHLSDRSGHYCGEPAPDACNRCLAQNGNYYNIRDDSEITSWRGEGYAWLGGARRIFVPHADVGERLTRYFPDLNYIERSHFETLSHGRFVAAHRLPGQPLRVALLGTIAPHKGSELLLDCSLDALQRGLPLQFVVLGTAEHADELLSAGVEITGEYQEEEVYDLLETRGCHCALFLSIWPETYCYTLSIALAGGLYSLVFDIGAQGARVRESGWGEALPLDSSPKEINDHLLTVGDKLHRLRAGPRPAATHYANILQDYYGLHVDLKPLEEDHYEPLSMLRRPPGSADRIALSCLSRCVS